MKRRGPTTIPFFFNGITISWDDTSLNSWDDTYLFFVENRLFKLMNPMKKFMNHPQKSLGHWDFGGSLVWMKTYMIFGVFVA